MAPYLAHDALVSQVTSVPPLGRAVLDFTAMGPDTFEQFCWWLLKKDHTLAGCKRLGGPGMVQGGIDLLAFDAADSMRLRVFECKARKKFEPNEMTQAVDKFLTGDWRATAASFTLILAQSDAGHALLRRWTAEKEKLKCAGIEGELWTAHNLTLKVERYPDILTRFFPFHSVETFANLWMERVAFHDLVLKSFFDPRDHVARWPRDLMGDEELLAEAEPWETEASSQLGEPPCTTSGCEE